MANHQKIPDKSVHTGVESKDVVVVIFCLPFQGHQNQLLNFSRIISSHNIPVHFVGPSTHNRQAKLRAQGCWDPLSSSNLHFHDITVPSFEAPPPDPSDPDKFPSHLMSVFNSVCTLRAPIFDLLDELAKTARRVVLILDFILLPVIDPEISSMPNTECYCFHVFPAFSVYYLACAFAGKPILIHGEAVRDLPPVDKAFGPQQTLAYARKELGSKKCYHVGNLYNTCRAIEGQFLDLLGKDKVQSTDKHWPLGPFTPVLASIPESEKKTTNKYLEWLDQQPPKSVIYVAFGTSISFSDEQVKEIAMGLERSGHNFVWGLRYADTADFSEEDQAGGRPQLPEGFEERNEGRGMIIRGWAPQLEILRHPSTGGFLTHCGWNSCIESMSVGVPMAAWPMHSEQPLNAILISRVLRIGVLVRECTVQINEIVKSEAIEEAVRRLMGSAEGEEMRQRAAQLSNAVQQAVKENGSTASEIANFIAHITR